MKNPSDMYNNFSFTRQDDETTNRVEFKGDSIDQIIYHFVDFLRGCGFVDETIYSYMEQQTDDYFECVKKDKPSKHADLSSLD
jgi:hypothetical protein